MLGTRDRLVNPRERMTNDDEIISHDDGSSYHTSNFNSLSMLHSKTHKYTTPNVDLISGKIIKTKPEHSIDPDQIMDLVPKLHLKPEYGITRPVNVFSVLDESYNLSKKLAPTYTDDVMFSSAKLYDADKYLDLSEDAFPVLQKSGSEKSLSSKSPMTDKLPSPIKSSWSSSKLVITSQDSISPNFNDGSTGRISSSPKLPCDGIRGRISSPKSPVTPVFTKPKIKPTKIALGSKHLQEALNEAVYDIDHCEIIEYDMYGNEIIPEEYDDKCIEETDANVEINEITEEEDQARLRDFEARKGTVW
jgi:hypothetical protein